MLLKTNSRCLLSWSYAHYEHKFTRSSLNLLSVLRQTHSLFQSKFCAECDLVIPLSIYSTLPSRRSSNSCLRLLPHLSVISILPSIFPWITCPRRQFVRNMQRIQLAHFLVTACRIFLSALTLCNTFSFLTWSIQLIFSHFLQHRISNWIWILILIHSVWCILQKLWIFKTSGICIGRCAVEGACLTSLAAIRSIPDMIK